MGQIGHGISAVFFRVQILPIWGAFHFYDEDGLAPIGVACAERLTRSIA
jgi:hypothetical protein